jgi:hypothetical protein
VPALLFSKAQAPPSWLLQIGLVIYYSERGSNYATTFFNGTTALIASDGSGADLLTTGTSLLPYAVALASILAVAYVLKVR